MSTLLHPQNLIVLNGLQSQQQMQQQTLYVIPQQQLIQPLPQCIQSVGSVQSFQPRYRPQQSYIIVTIPATNPINPRLVTTNINGVNRVNRVNRVNHVNHVNRINHINHVNKFNAINGVKPFNNSNKQNNLNMVKNPVKSQTFSTCFSISDAVNAVNKKTEKRTSNKYIVDKMPLLDNYKCKICGKQFKYQTNLVAHKKVHGIDCPKCKYCGKKFARLSNLKQHIRIHTNERPYSCKWCPKSFKQKHSLTDHIRSHTGERPFQCDICYKRFAVKHNMKVHKRIHTGEKPYSCTICNTSYGSKSGHNSHIKHKHPEIWKNKQSIKLLKLQSKK